jgi:hypothetical protein
VDPIQRGEPLEQRDACLGELVPAIQPLALPEQFPLDSGGVCGSRLGVQFDHIDMRVDGGRATVANTRVACGFHNRLAARLRLGNRMMDRYCRDPRQVEIGEGAG